MEFLVKERPEKGVVYTIKYLFTCLVSCEFNQSQGISESPYLL